MADDRDRQQSDEAEFERKLREGRKFTPQEAMARMAGPGAMKGASPISPAQQAETEIGTWLRSNVTDPAGALQLLLHRQLRDSQLLHENIEQPLAALASHCRQLLASDFLLKELVREADVEWGRRMEERPLFDKEGAPPDPGDPYTADSVRSVLGEILQRLAAGAGE
jgi:hypothetical protein